MGDQAFAACEATVRRADPDRYFSTLFAPAGKRPFLFALYAFNHEIARIGEVVRALSQTFEAVELPLELCESMLDARAADFSLDMFSNDALHGYIDSTSG